MVIELVDMLILEVLSEIFLNTGSWCLCMGYWYDRFGSSGGH